MDIEQLRLILETVQAAGEGAKVIAILYLVSTLVQPVLTSGVLVLAIVAVTRIVRHVSGMMNASWLVAERLKYDVAGCWGSSDTTEVLRRIKELQDK